MLQGAVQVLRKQLQERGSELALKVPESGRRGQAQPSRFDTPDFSKFSIANFFSCLAKTCHDVRRPFIFAVLSFFTRSASHLRAILVNLNRSRFDVMLLHLHSL